MRIAWTPDLTIARDPNDVPFFDRYALRMAPSLRAVVTSADRMEQQGFDGDHLSVQDPLGDLLEGTKRNECVLDLKPRLMLSTAALAPRE